MTAARSTTTGTGESSRTCPTSPRERKCGEGLIARGQAAQVDNARRTFAAAAAAANVRAARLSASSKRRPLPRAWIK